MSYVWCDIAELFGTTIFPIITAVVGGVIVYWWKWILETKKLKSNSFNHDLSQRKETYKKIENLIKQYDRSIRSIDYNYPYSTLSEEWELPTEYSALHIFWEELEKVLREDRFTLTPKPAKKFAKLQKEIEIFFETSYEEETAEQLTDEEEMQACIEEREKKFVETFQDPLLVLQKLLRTDLERLHRDFP